MFWKGESHYLKSKINKYGIKTELENHSKPNKRLRDEYTL